MAEIIDEPKYRLSVAKDERGFIPDTFWLAREGEQNPLRIFQLKGDWPWVLHLAEGLIRRAKRTGYLYG